MCSPNTLATLSSARLIANHAISREIFSAPPPAREPFRHLGAAIGDSVLQAGVNYRTVVAPRTRRIIDHFPEAHDLNGLLLVLRETSVASFLDWNHFEKIGRFSLFVEFLSAHSLETTEDLRKFVEAPVNRSSLLSVRGIGPKTIDYLSCLLGSDAVAIDRHMIAFAQEAGLSIKTYDDLRDAYTIAADLLEIGRSDFDWAVWRSVSLQNPQQNLPF